METLEMQSESLDVYPSVGDGISVELMLVDVCLEIKLPLVSMLKLSNVRVVWYGYILLLE